MRFPRHHAHLPPWGIPHAKPSTHWTNPSYPQPPPKPIRTLTPVPPSGPPRAIPHPMIINSSKAIRNAERSDLRTRSNRALQRASASTFPPNYEHRLAIACTREGVCPTCATHGVASNIAHGGLCVWCSPGYLRHANAKEWYLADYRPQWAHPGSTPPGW